MKTCPHCRQQIPVEARECKFCHKAVVRGCPTCGAEVYLTTRTCPHCSADIAGPPPPAPAVALRHFGPVGEERNIALWVILGIFTACIGPFIWIYQMAEDLNAHGGRERLTPVTDMLLTILTCGIWFIYVCYKYTDTYCQIVREEGGEPRSDLPVLNLVIGIFIPIVALAVLQNEMNEHWRKHAMGR